MLGMASSGSATALDFPIESDASPKFWIDVNYFRGQDQKTKIEIYYSVALRELKVSEMGEKLGLFDIDLTVKDSQNQAVFTESRSRGVRPGPAAEPVAESRGVVDQYVFYLPAGEYKLEAKVTDKNAKAKSSVAAAMQVPSFDNGLGISEPQLATVITKDLSNKVFVKGNQAILPNPSRRYRYQNSILNFFYEVYNLTATPGDSSGNFQVAYAITDVLGDSLIVIPKQMVSKPGSTSSRVQSFDIRGLEKGEHVLAISVSDPASGQSAVVQKRFFIHDPMQDVQILPMTNEDIKRYREQIKYLATRDELQVFDQLNPKGKEAFLLNFWHSKDADPSTAVNEFMQNYFSRIDYANKHFKGKSGGQNTDMGRVFIIFGQPDDIGNHIMEIHKKPYIVWYYYQSGQGKQEFVFVDRNNEGIYVLVHSTVEGELKNYNWRDQELQ